MDTLLIWPSRLVDKGRELGRDIPVDSSERVLVSESVRVSESESRG